MFTRRTFLKFRNLRTTFTILDSVDPEKTEVSIPDTLSAVDRGKKFEDFVISFLNSKYNLKLVPTGQKGDFGIDFRGYWEFPDQRIGVVGQCKYEKKKMSPKYVRDLCGSMEKESENTLGLLVCSRGWTEECHHQLNMSNRALMFLQIDVPTQELKRVSMNTTTKTLLPGLSFSKDLDSLHLNAIIMTYKSQSTNRSE